MNKGREITKIPSGVPGLDEILKGGYIATDAYLVRGGPGTGKTTIGIQFLYEGVKKGETSLFIALSETVDKIKRNSKQKGIDMGGTIFLDLTPSTDEEDKEQSYNIFSPSEVEQPSFIERINEELKKHQPDRIFVDGITQLHYLFPDVYQFRKQILSLINLATANGGTIVISSEASQTINDDDIQFMSDGVINLEFVNDERGARVTKFRGSDFMSGFHSMRLSSTGMIIYPKLDPEANKRDFVSEKVSSGVAELDELLHGGIEKGTATVISGPTGVGKTTMGAQFVKEASERGERSVIYTFEERKEALIGRCESINIPIGKMMDKGNLSVVKVNPLQYTPEQFSYLVRSEVEKMDAKIIMLDSISGYLLSFTKGPRDRDDMLRHLYSLSEYLKNMGVTLLLINEVHNITGDFKVTEYGISYLADNIVFLRYLEVKGEMHKAIGVLKKRMSDFEKNLREFTITKQGLKVGQPLRGLRGILEGKPEFIINE